MLSQLLKELLALDAQRITPQFLDRSKTHYLLDGKPGETPPPRIVAVCERLQSLCDWASRLDACTVYVSADRVEARDKSHGLRRAIFELRPDPVWTKIAALADTPQAMLHRPFIQFLERDLELPEATIAPFRAVSFAGQSAAASEMQRRADRVGRDIREAVSAETPIPDELLLSVPIYESPEETHPYTLAIPLTVVAADQSFTLRPARRELRERVRVHLESIFARVTEELHSDTTPMNGIIDMPLADIIVGQRFTELDESEAQRIAEQMRGDRGLLQAIGVSADDHLVWGRHRLQAAAILGWKTIPARRMEYSHDDPQAFLDQLDENLARRKLTTAEESALLAKRKVIYLAAHPETRRGAKGGRQTAAAETSATGQRWIDDRGRFVQVFRGLGKSGWMCGTITASGGWHRLKSPSLKTRTTQAKAQDDLDSYARRKNWNPVPESTNLTATVADSSPRPPKDSVEYLQERLAQVIDPASDPRDTIARVKKSFAEDTAEMTGKSERTVRRQAELGAKLDGAAIKLLAAKAPHVANSPAQLKKLARLDPDMQRAVAASIVAGDKRADGRGPVLTVDDALADAPHPNEARDDKPGVPLALPVSPAEPRTVESAADVLKRLLEKTKSAWRATCGHAATAQLGAAVLESVSAVWMTEQWK
jgi:hypothetical protein